MAKDILSGLLSEKTRFVVTSGASDRRKKLLIVGQPETLMGQLTKWLEGLS